MKKHTNRYYMYISLILIFTLLMSSVAFASGYENLKKDNFMVMGYFSELPFDDPIDDNIDFNGLTHIIYAFLKPNPDGTLIDITKPDRLNELVEKAHENDVKVVIAIGGWSYKDVPIQGIFETLATSDKGIENFVNDAIKYVNKYNLDGIELDWEYPNEQSAANYEKLVVALGDALRENGKSFSAALAGSWSKVSQASSLISISDVALNEFEWINIMAYDFPVGHHSPYWFSESSMGYWLSRGVPKEKVILGLPLYARPSWKQYRHLVEMDKSNAYRDYAKGDKLDSYYNGIYTIKQKTRLALARGGGIMFFDINEDTHDETSCQKAALEVINSFNQYGLNDLYIIVDEKQLQYDQDEGMGMPYIDSNNRTLIPIRKALEIISAEVDYDDSTQTITAKRNDTTINLQVGKNTITINGVETEMDTVVVMKDARTYLPLKWIYESFGYKVSWFESSRSIFVENIEATDIVN